jgi:hypothetical protein
MCEGVICYNLLILLLKKSSEGYEYRQVPNISPQGGLYFTR